MVNDNSSVDGVVKQPECMTFADKAGERAKQGKYDVLPGKPSTYKARNGRLQFVDMDILRQYGAVPVEDVRKYMGGK